MSRIIAAFLSIAVCSIGNAMYDANGGNGRSFYDLYQTELMNKVVTVVVSTSHVSTTQYQEERCGQVIAQPHHKKEVTPVQERTDFDRFILRSPSESNLTALADPGKSFKQSVLSSSRELMVGPDFYE